MNKRVIFSDKSDSLLQSYFRDISKYKILDNEEINKLIVEAQNGDEKAREKVITSNLRFVVTIAKQFQNRGIPLMDLISSGLEGLCKSVNKFDPTRGVKFLNYSAWWIKQCIYTTIYLSFGFPFVVSILIILIHLLVKPLIFLRLVQLNVV